MTQTMAPDQALQMWIDYADELSEDPTFLADMADPREVEQVKAWAQDAGVPFPPPACIDTALEYARIRGLDDGTASTAASDEDGEPML